jgi:hypothetical protein
MVRRLQGFQGSKVLIFSNRNNPYKKQSRSLVMVRGFRELSCKEIFCDKIPSNSPAPLAKIGIINETFWMAYVECKERSSADGFCPTRRQICPYLKLDNSEVRAAFFCEKNVVGLEDFHKQYKTRK